MRGPPVRGAVHAIAAHYPPPFTSAPEALALSAEWGKPLWSTEDGPWGGEWRVVPPRTGLHRHEF